MPRTSISPTSRPARRQPDTTPGTGGIAWSAADFAAHDKPFPAVHIDQDASASHYTSDILDVEPSAASPAEVARWVTNARANYVPFWIAQWGIGVAQARSNVANGSGGSYPTVGWQYENGTYVDYDVFSVPWLTTVSGPAQLGWNWCYKCQGMFYGWNASHGVCPAGGAHNGSRSYDYSMTYGTVPRGYQGDWHWCGKCQGLFYNPQQSVSTCPAGGRHGGSRSWSYAVAHGTIPPGDQARWNWCRKCRGMFYGPHQPSSHCPAGSTHNGTGSYNYGMAHGH